MLTMAPPRLLALAALLGALVAAPVAAQPRQITLRVAAGGANPDRFCMPTWSFSNDTGADIGDLLVMVEWRNRSTGAVLVPASKFGTMVRQFSAGVKKDMFAAGHPSACNDLQIVVSTYACRDKNAVRIPCPGPIVVQPTGGVTADTSALKEGSMAGAVERR